MAGDNPLEDIIRKEGNDDSAVFIFPSDIAATLWLEEALTLTGKETLPVRRFIAWDRFKEQAVQATVAGKRPVTAVLRKLYALELAERNRTCKPPLFTSLIPAMYAAEGTVFASWIARLLPQLEMWSQKTGRAHGWSPDSEDADLRFLQTDYQRFLETNLLFEPSWQKPPLADKGERYFIFFPEAIEDYSEYESLLDSAPFITTIHVPPPPNNEGPAIQIHDTSRSEIQAVALQIEELLMDGVQAEDIALSVSDLETVSPYLLREFALRGIPVEYRAGETLGTRPAGRLFALIAECVSTNFSFASLKALLLDRLVPWKERETAEALVSFGIRNHCVTSWKEDGMLMDVWEEAFKTPTEGASPDREGRALYRELKKALTQMADAPSFTEIRNRYFVFRMKFLDSTRYSSEDDAVVARCVEELNTLAGLEKTYGDYIPNAPYSFYLSVLDEKNYVAQRTRGGVSIYPYRVAAGTPYTHHFILDASQDQTTILYRQLSFLRQDKRTTLNIKEKDASDAFFNMYRCAPRTGVARTGARFSFADRSFTGYRTPHGYFRSAEIYKPTERMSDPFADEKKYFSAQDSLFPSRIYRSQKQGRSSWNALDVGRGFSYLKSPFESSLPHLDALIEKKQINEGNIRVSATDLDVFSQCNARWFLGKMLRIEVTASDAELLNERNLGLLYHDILQKLYEKIFETDKVFTASHLDEYRAWAVAFAEQGASSHAEFRGPLAAPLISTLVKKISDALALMLARDADILDGFIPEFLERDMVLVRGGIRYYGRIDRISRRPSDGTAVLIDYKSGKAPSTSKYITDGTVRIGDFQIPMYVFLAEEADDSPYKGTRIEHAWFGSVKEGDFRPIINDNDALKCGSKRGMVTRDEFKGAMDSFHEMTGYFAQAVREGNFTRPESLDWAECVSCDFQKICRFTYAVRP